MVKLQEAENQIVVAYEVYDQRPIKTQCLGRGLATFRRKKPISGAVLRSRRADPPAGRRRQGVK